MQLPPNEPAARPIGIDPLKPETSTNFSVGFLAHPAGRIVLTLDAYQISIRNRVVRSGALYGTHGACNLYLEKEGVKALTDLEISYRLGGGATISARRRQPLQGLPDRSERRGDEGQRLGGQPGGRGLSRLLGDRHRRGY